MRLLRRLANRLRILRRHPLARRSPFLTVVRWCRWRMLARGTDAAIVVPLVGDTKIRVRARNVEARAYAYLGLAEFEDMGFVLHAVGPADLFVDVGAYVGGYTLLAAGACGARVIAVEPNPDNRDDLVHNIALNRLEAKVEVVAAALGDAPSTVAMSAGDWSSTRVLRSAAASPSFAVPMHTLDAIVGDRSPAFLKIDVEGFEARVLAGGGRTLASEALLAVIVELNGSGTEYGDDDASIHAGMIGRGFHSYRYDPASRQLVSLDDRLNAGAGNTLYVRSADEIRRRLAAAPVRRLHGTRL